MIGIYIYTYSNNDLRLVKIKILYSTLKQTDTDKMTVYFWVLVYV